MGFVGLDGSAYNVETEDSFDEYVQNLPWGNKWLRGERAVNEMLPVLGVLKYDTGLMVVTKFYKAYLKVGEYGYAHLLEALKVWAESKESVFPLFCVLSKKGFPKLAVNDELLNKRWNFYGDRWMQQFSPEVDEGKKEPEVNPLLAGGRGTGTTVGKQEATSKGRK